MKIRDFLENISLSYPILHQCTFSVFLLTNHVLAYRIQQYCIILYRMPHTVLSFVDVVLYGHSLQMCPVQYIPKHRLCCMGYVLLDICDATSDVFGGRACCYDAKFAVI